MNEHEQEFYQRIKDSIKENVITIDPNTFEPIKKITLEMRLELAQDLSDTIGTVKMYEMIGRAIFDSSIHQLAHNTPTTPFLGI
jgi:DNA replication initiation complex subunit (GINS family)